MRRVVKSILYKLMIFQSTHPLRDATDEDDKGAVGQRDFNPRTPYGMRRNKIYRVSIQDKFQSTHPLRDATPLLN